MMKKKPIAFKNIEEMNNWMANNFDDYLEANEFLEDNFYNISDTKEKAIASIKYSVERLFCFYYESLKKLLILRNKDEKLKQFIEEYHIYKNDKEYIENWYSNIGYYMDKIDYDYCGMSIEYQNNNPIGIKPFESQIYKENPYVLPIDGFENFIELAKIINLNQEKYLFGQSFNSK